MKILWIVNIMLPVIARSLNRPFSVREGWLSGIFDRMTADKSEYELAIAFPTTEGDMPEYVNVKGVDCYSFYENLSKPEYYDEALEERLAGIISKVKPDIVHIFGTEFPHAKAALRVWNNPSKTLVGLQGVVSEIAKDYMALIPKRVSDSKTFRDFLKKDSLKEQQEKFFKRADNETAVLKLTENVTGRTDFDKRSALSVNPKCNYYHMNETMRSAFYEGKWEMKNAHRHRIFIGQADYPLKGMHFLIKAAGELLNDYPDLEIVFAGNSVINSGDLKSKIKTPGYGKYLKELIKENKLKGKVIHLGSLSMEEMKEEYLRCSVFVCASYVENSPNTVAEAMLLGVPLICSNAGGILSVVSDKEALIFERGDHKELSLLIRQIFEEEEAKSEVLLKRLSDERNRAFEQYNGNENYKVLLNIYSKIANEE